MDGWDGWGSPIGEVSDGAECQRGQQPCLDIRNIGYPIGRVDHGEDVSRDIAAALSGGDALDAWPGWTTTGLGR